MYWSDQVRPSVNLIHNIRHLVRHLNWSVGLLLPLLLLLCSIVIVVVQVVRLLLAVLSSSLSVISSERVSVCSNVFLLFSSLSWWVAVEFYFRQILELSLIFILVWRTNENPTVNAEYCLQRWNISTLCVCVYSIVYKDLFSMFNSN